MPPSPEAGPGRPSGRLTPSLSGESIQKFFVPLSPLTSPMPKYEFRPMPLRGSVVVKNSGSNQFLERDGHHVVEGLEISRVVGRRAVLT